MSPELTVIIPTWNRRELLGRCLASLRRQTVAATVLVVDNGSSDGTAALLEREYPAVECLVQKENLGFARAVNLGILACRTPFLALLNNDTEVETDWVEQGLRGFREYPECDFFASRMIHFTSRGYLDSAGDCYDRFGMPYKRGYGEPFERFTVPEPVLGASAGAAFYRRSLFDRVGLFEEEFYMYLEDVELSLRAQMQGRRCLFLPAARVYHIEAASDSCRPESSPTADPDAGPPRPVHTDNRVYWITRNRWLLMCLYQPFRHWPYLIFGWLRSWAFHFFKAGHRRAFVRGLGAGFKATSWALRRRRQIRELRTISDRELCRLLRQC